jgi:conserved oligomeric Golgi complex subunit 4
MAVASGQKFEGTSGVYSAKSVAEIRVALAQLQQHEANVASRLDFLISEQRSLQRELGRLDLFRAGLSTHASKTRSISNGMLSDAASTAKRISSSVKKLDLEQERVKATLTVVEQVAELKACVLGVSGSMDAAQDWETAASYLARASKIPKDVITGDFAARVVPTAEVPDQPAVTLEHASESLCGLYLREFDKAVKENDGGKITRFFKLFPLINRSEVGLDVYGQYVCQGVAARARANLNAGTGGNQSKDGFFYSNALTKLFEHIASIIEGHGGLVERHYGAGKMARVIERLQMEADLQGGIILDTWADERRIDRQLTDIKAYPYTFLVQSFAAPARNNAGTPRSHSPAPARISEDEGVDMRQVDLLLNEMTSMLNKWSLYTRFVTEKCNTAGKAEEVEPPTPMFLTNSVLARKIQERVIAPFNTMTTFFFRRSVEKAFQLDEQPSELTLDPRKPLLSSPPHISSAIEDIMYIVNKVLTQSLTTAQAPIVSSVLPSISRVLNSDFIGLQQRKMRDESYPKAAIPGQLPPEATIISFIVLINNLDVSTTYITQIINSRITPTNASTPQLSTLFPTPAELQTATTALNSLTTAFTEKTTALLSDAASVLFNNVTKPRLRPIIADAFRDTDYQLTRTQHEDLVSSLTDSGAIDSGSFSPEVRQRFALGWDALLKPLGRLLTDRASDLLLTQTLSYFAKLLEKRIWSYSGRVNALGAPRLEHDVNEVVRIVVKGQKYSYRELFERCRQICVVMTMEEEEWEEVESGEDGGEGVADRLSAEERMSARAMIREIE